MAGGIRWWNGKILWGDIPGNGRKIAFDEACCCVTVPEDDCYQCDNPVPVHLLVHFTGVTGDNNCGDECATVFNAVNGFLLRAQYFGDNDYHFPEWCLWKYTNVIDCWVTPFFIIIVSIYDGQLHLTVELYQPNGNFVDQIVHFVHTYDPATICTFNGNETFTLPPDFQWTRFGTKSCNFDNATLTVIGAP
jgi:hypothetical protein